MIPIKYFMCENTPNDKDICEAMDLVEKEDCVVVIKWIVFKSTYLMTIRKGMTFDECRIQIPTVYGI